MMFCVERVILILLILYPQVLSNHGAFYVSSPAILSSAIRKFSDLVSFVSFCNLWSIRQIEESFSTKLICQSVTISWRKNNIFFVFSHRPKDLSSISRLAKLFCWHQQAQKTCWPKYWPSKNFTIITLNQQKNNQHGVCKGIASGKAKSKECLIEQAICLCTEVRSFKRPHAVLLSLWFVHLWSLKNTQDYYLKLKFSQYIHTCNWNIPRSNVPSLVISCQLSWENGESLTYAFHF